MEPAKTGTLHAFQMSNSCTAKFKREILSGKKRCRPQGFFSLHIAKQY